MISRYITRSFATLPALVLFAFPTLAHAADDDVNANLRADLPAVPRNSPSGRFGDKGQIAVSSDAGLSLSNTSVSGVDGSTTSLILRPALDWFFADSISLGGFLGVEYTKSPGGSSSVISIGPRIGYNLPLSQRTSIWPKVGFSFASTSTTDEGAVGDEDETNTAFQLNLFVPFMFHPSPHFFLGLGPALDADLSGDSKATTLAVRLTIGGWVGPD